MSLFSFFREEAVRPYRPGIRDSAVETDADAAFQQEMTAFAQQAATELADLGRGADLARVLTNY